MREPSAQWRIAMTFALMLVALPACLPKAPPNGQPEQPPAVDLPPDGSPVCQPGAICGCSHKPPASDWIRLPDCAAPPPAGETDCDGQLGAEVVPTQSRHADVVRRALVELYRCEAGRCVVNASRHEVQRAVIGKLREWGYCAGQHQPGSSVEDYGSDEIGVSDNPTGPREQYHVYVGPAGGPGTLLFPPEAIRRTWLPAGSAPPPDGPPRTGACTAPLPPMFWTRETLPDGWGEDEIGKPRWEMKCQRHGRVVDCTPVVAPQACAYCASIGMGTYADGQLRCNCPVRPEGHPEREPCETYLIGATIVLSSDGQTCERTDNPLQFVPRDGNCRLCDETGQVCGDWF